MKFVFLTYIILTSSITLAADCSSTHPSVFPKFSKFVTEKHDSFIKENGKFKLLSISKSDLKEFCEKGIPVKNNKLFSSQTMTDLIITRDCKSKIGGRAELTKITPNHPVLAAKFDIIGGGQIECVGKKSNPEDNLIYLTNHSSRYCFPFENLKYSVKELLKFGIKREKIFIKFKQAKFCKQKASRVDRYLKIIEKKSYDFGLKKSHIYRADQFLRLFPNAD
ncbi:MAG: hypothetical protein ACJAT2_000193 [Bacteriovoracaceae bacterium]|jgi:hypothetical protein